MLQYEPTHRITAKDAMRHAYFAIYLQQQHIQDQRRFQQQHHSIDKSQFHLLGQGQQRY